MTTILNEMLNLFIGLALTFGSISLMTSAITEALAAITGWRARTLLSGLKQLLNDKDLSGLAGAVLAHAGANPLSDGKSAAKPTATPSYIDPARFASALLDVLSAAAPAAGVSTAIQARFQGSTDTQLPGFLQGIARTAGDDAERFKQEVAAWFDSSMDRVAGIYKRHAQVASFLVGLVLAAALNVDALRLAQVLWTQPDIVQGFHPSATDYPSLQAAWLQSFPFGWPGTGVGVLTLCGWLITASAVLFGAPFWFDALQSFIQVRSTGPSPPEKKPAA